MKQNHKEIKYLISSVIFMVLLNFPILSIFNKNSTINGIPALFFYVFTVWAVFIGFLYWSVKKEEQQAVNAELERGEELIQAEEDTEFLKRFDENLAKGHEVESPILTLGIDDVERPGDYITSEDEESKKKTYMTKDQSGQLIVKTRE
jgi:hypothetical protein